MAELSPPPVAELNLSWVTPTLAVGGRIAPEALPELGELGVKHVVDLRIEEQDDELQLRALGIDFLPLPTPDNHAVSQQMLWEGVYWVSAHLARGERVLIHCQHGVGRSALLALCVLVADGHPPLEALRVAKQGRWQISPSPEQLEALRMWAEEFKVANGATWEVPTFQELARMAYAHLHLE